VIEQTSLGLTVDGKPRRRRVKGDGSEPPLTLRAPDPVLQVLRAEAARQGISMSFMARAALIAYARNLEQRAA
jgi:hypothetical protein